MSLGSSFEVYSSKCTNVDRTLFVIKAAQWMFFREIIAVYFDTHTTLMTDSVDKE
jgi:hypothetical protein